MKEILQQFRQQFQETYLMSQKRIYKIANNDEMSKLCDKMLSANIVKPLEITVAVHKQQRSVSQNKLFHMHIGEIRKHYGETQGDYYTAEVWKKYYKDLFLETTINSINGVMSQSTQETSSLKVKEMSEFIEKVIMHAADELNCQVTIPQDLFNEAMGIR